MTTVHQRKPTDEDALDWDTPTIESLGDGMTPAVKAGPFGSALTKDQYVPVGFKVYGQEQVIRGDHTYGDYFISPKKYRELESCAVRPGDVLLSLVGTVGRLLEIPEGALPGVINPRLIRFSLNKKLVDSRFFRHLFESAVVQRQLEQLAQGGTMGVLNAGVLRSFRISLPKITEQRAIATALSDVDALIAGLERLIAKKRDIKQATMQQLLTGQTRLPGFSGEWSRKRLGELAEMGSGGTPPAGNPGYYGGNIPWVAISDMTQAGKFLERTERSLSDAGLANSAAQLFPAGTVLYAMYASLGECSIACMDLCTSQAILGIRPRAGLIRDFLYYVLTSRRELVKTMGQQGTQSNLNKGIVQGFEILLPPVEEQTSIATVLSDMDADIEALESRLAKTRAIKQGMMQELLTGRTRLPEVGEK